MNPKATDRVGVQWHRGMKQVRMRRTFVHLSGEGTSDGIWVLNVEEAVALMEQLREAVDRVHTDPDHQWHHVERS